MNSQIKTILLAAALTLVMAGCSTDRATGPKFSDYRVAIPPMAKDKGRIWFYGNWGEGIPVELDGNAAGDSLHRSFFYVDVPPGSHEISCTSEVTYHTPLTVEAGQEKFIRLSLKFGIVNGRIKPEEVAQEQALKEMRNLRFAAP